MDPLPLEKKARVKTKIPPARPFRRWDEIRLKCEKSLRHEPPRARRRLTTTQTTRCWKKCHLIGNSQHIRSVTAAPVPPQCQPQSVFSMLVLRLSDATCWRCVTWSRNEPSAACHHSEWIVRAHWSVRYLFRVPAERQRREKSAVAACREMISFCLRPSTSRLYCPSVLESWRTSPFRNCKCPPRLRRA